MNQSIRVIAVLLVTLGGWRPVRAQTVFTEVGQQAGVGDNLGVNGTVVWTDYNGDGWLDLYVCNLGTMIQGYITEEGITIYDSTFAVPSRLYRNSGNGGFAEVGIQAGVNAPGVLSWSGVWGDYDNDGFPDLYVLNVGGASNQMLSRLYQNNGDGSFVEVTTSAGVGDEGGNVGGMLWTDYNQDGLLDLYACNNPAFDTQGNVDFMNSVPSRLYRNNGDGTFTDVAASAGVADDKIGFGDGPLWGDFDNDGFLDLYVLNLASSSPCRLYRNNGDGTFTDVGIEVGVNIPDGSSAAWGDYDNDGFLDLFVTVIHFTDAAMIAAPNLLFHNEGNGNHWLVVQLRGTASNRDGIGARVIAVTGKIRQRRDVENAGPGWHSQPSLPVEFGFGSATVVDSLLIRWPSGIEQALTQVDVDQYLMLEESNGREPTAVAEERTAAVPGSFVLAQNYPNPFNGETVIRFELPVGGEVELGVYDLAGQRVVVLAQGWREAGSYAMRWDGRDDGGRGLASGVYLYQLRAGDRVETRRLALVR